MGMEIFRREGIEYLVMEHGMGGRLTLPMRGAAVGLHSDVH